MSSARARRERELCQLFREGVPLRAMGKSGHWIIGRLHIYAACGRCFNERTCERGRLNGHSMRGIVGLEYTQPNAGMTAAALTGYAAQTKQTVPYTAATMLYRLARRSTQKNMSSFVRNARKKACAFAALIDSNYAISDSAARTREDAPSTREIFLVHDSLGYLRM